MPPVPSVIPFEELRTRLDGELFDTYDYRVLYATDASVYREVPLAVCRPAHKEDIRQALEFCDKFNLPLIPRTAGTSLAGQVVGKGLVLDCSRHMNQILELNVQERWIRVQPGVILDELNDFLKPHGLFFAPETSTSNRCMIGGMVANNACGAHSLVYGSTRDHLLSLEAMLSDGSEVCFQAVDNKTFREKCIGSRLENNIYKNIYDILSDDLNQQQIREHFPDPRLNRRNTGYAIDILLNSALFSEGGRPFNFCHMLAGSEGTLAVFTALKLNLLPLPPKEKALVCIHLNNVAEALQANLIALKHKPVAVELIDRMVLDCTKQNITQNKNRFFIEGDPGAILVVEFAGDTQEYIGAKAQRMEKEMRGAGLGYCFPLMRGKQINKVWALRKAGLGVLSNMPGDAKPVAVIEDTAIHVESLPSFVAELQQMLDKLRLTCVFYAHTGTGEIHMRPVMNLKDPTDVEKFYQVAIQTARLVKRYRGSLSGEHGDGRLRSEFIPLMLGEKNMLMLESIKKCWDPKGILNPGKITRPVSMKASLRYEAGRPERKLKTWFLYPEAGSFLQAVEKCNGSGDCRKPFSQSGAMCPSYQATLNEDSSTRGRANVLREYITRSPEKNPFNHKELLNVLDLCLSCKACKAECPSNVDMSRFKAEVWQQFYQSNARPLSDWMIAHFAVINRAASMFPGLYNSLLHFRPVSGLIKKTLRLAPERALPYLSTTSLRRWADRNLPGLNSNKNGSKAVIFFCDEFTNYYDARTGIQALLLLSRLGYHIEMPEHAESGRAQLSKGMLKQSRQLAQKNVNSLSSLVSAQKPLIGLEPSAILTFRDEYPDLLRDEEREKALCLAEHCMTLEEFICNESDRGHIDAGLFSSEPVSAWFHGHCHQKALSDMDFTRKMLSIPSRATVHEIRCGCCGMAGSFGYEKKHYALSMQIGEQTLFPAIREVPPGDYIVASGFSCRQQILDGTGRQALHPAALLFGLLKNTSHS
jgi:FAD/FMN-containing dehydrogenase/Fe-S oxidoreductase